jgi:hypothetical protein
MIINVSSNQLYKYLKTIDERKEPIEQKGASSSCEPKKDWVSATISGLEVWAKLQRLS